MLGFAASRQPSRFLASSELSHRQRRLQLPKVDLRIFLGRRDGDFAVRAKILLAQVGACCTYMVLNGFRTANRTRQAESQVEGARETLRVTELQVLLDPQPRI